MKIREMSVCFCKHLVERYQERMKDMDSTPMENINPDDIHNYEWINNDQLEREIKLKGKFFRRDDFGKEGQTAFTCVVKNFKVYDGFFDEEYNKLYITTVYPYSKYVRKFMRSDKKIEFEDG